MSMTTPIVDFVRSYAQSGTARLHMPGHKGQSLLGFEPLDITEICGADELYAQEGIIAESEANATRLFGTAHSYYSTEGSSQCIRAMLFLALQSAPQSGKRPVLLAARNPTRRCCMRRRCWILIFAGFGRLRRQRGHCAAAPLQPKR